MISAKRDGQNIQSGPKSLRSHCGLARSVLPVAVSLLVLPGLYWWPAYEYVERNDSGFHYRDWKGSPYDQIRTGDPRIDQITCPPSIRPHCGG